MAHDLLVKLITDVQPFEPYWEDLREIDLSAKGAESAARLKEFLPKLEEVNLCAIQLGLAGKTDEQER